MIDRDKTAIAVHGLVKQYGTLKAVDSLEMSVSKGRIFGFLGPNGAGKTTTIKMIAGLTKPDRGSIYLAGAEVRFGSIRGREKIGYLPDVPECYGYMNAVEYLFFCASLYGNSLSENRRKAFDLLEHVGLAGTTKRIASFSRGMKQRLGIAQALINQPDIVLMDEPASALDPLGRFEVMEIIRNLKGSVTVFFSSHILADIERVCDEIAIIHKGRILETGPVTALREKYDRKSLSVQFPATVSPVVIEKLIQEIKRQSWCRDIEQSDQSSVKLYSVNKSVAQTELIKMVASKNIPIESYQSNAVSLEDIFLEVVHS